MASMFLMMQKQGSHHRKRGESLYRCLKNFEDFCMVTEQKERYLTLDKNKN